MTRKEEIQENSENELGTIDYQVGFSQGAQWADKTMIEKACEWLERNFNMPDDFKEHFKQAMMGE